MPTEPDAVVRGHRVHDALNHREVGAGMKTMTGAIVTPIDIGEVMTETDGTETVTTTVIVVEMIGNLAVHHVPAVMAAAAGAVDHAVHVVDLIFQKVLCD